MALRDALRCAQDVARGSGEVRAAPGNGRIGISHRLLGTLAPVPRRAASGRSAWLAPSRREIDHEESIPMSENLTVRHEGNLWTCTDKQHKLEHVGFIDLVTRIRTELGMRKFTLTFDCDGKALQPDETAICTNRDLNDLDVRMATEFKWLSGMYAMGVRGELQDQQTAWLKTRQACQSDIACIRKAYDDRLKVFRDAERASDRCTSSASRTQNSRRRSGTPFREPADWWPRNSTAPACRASGVPRTRRRLRLHATRHARRSWHRATSAPTAGTPAQAD